MTLSSVVAGGREAANRLMTDVGKITRNGEPTFNPETGQLTDPAPTVIYGPDMCRVRMPTTIEMNRLFGERDVSITRYMAVFPWDSPPAKIGDVVTVLESEDSALLIVTLPIVLIARMTHLMYRTYGCEVVE